MICARLSSRIVRSLTLITVGLFIGVFQSPMTTAQTAEFTQGSKNSNTLTLEVPLGNYPGRGISLPVTLRYSSQGLWRVGFINSVQVNVWGYNIHRSVAESIYAEHSTAGWKTSLDVPKIEWPKLNDRYFANGNPYARGYVYPYTHRVANVYVHMPDGSTHELRKADQVYQDNNYVDVTGTFYAVDGSRMRYDSSGATTGTLYLPDGARWIFNGSTVQYIDRNGNTLNYDTATRQWTDTLGRAFNMPWPANPSAGDYPYQLPGVNGSVLNYTLKFRHLSDVLAPGTPGLQPIGDHYLPNPASPPTSQNGGNFPQPTGTSTMFTSEYVDEENQASYTYVVGRMQSGANVFNPVVLSEIVLPNGRNYVFTYNNYGELARVVLPTGGYQRYAHAYAPPLAFVNVPFNQGSRGMSSQWISPSGSGTDESQWTYSTTGTILTITAPDDTGAPNGLSSQTLIHYNSAQNSNFGYQDARTGLPYEERVYAPASQGGAMLRRTLTEYAQTSATYNRPSPYSGTYTAYRNARATKSVSLMLDTGGNALASSRTTSYDPTYQFSVGLDATATNDYGFAIVDQTTAQTAPISSMPFGPLVRSKQTSFLTSDPGYRNRNILGLASYVTISNGASQIVSQSSFAYDEAGYPLLTYGSLTGWTDPQTSYRGNATSANRWLDYPTSTWLTTHTQYDQAGSARNAWDARGNQSQVEYSTTFARALPTQTTTAVPDPTGTHGTNTPLVATANYDFNTGLVTSTTDANAKTTTFEYNDPLNRITRVNFPDGGRTTMTYVDAHSCGSYMQTRTLLTASGTETDSYTFFDGLARPYRAFTYENQDTGNPFLTLDTQYDKLGRSWRTSNPYRSNGCASAINPSGTWTTNAYDSLSRITSVTTPDGAQASMVYSASTTGSYIGPSVSATDPAGKARRSISDSSGRVIQVIEDPNGLAYQTNYTYDAQNNLRRVEQGSQHRFYGYDSLSRVIRVNTVEQTVNGALYWPDPVTGNTGWTMSLSYDANDNVTSRVDARNISTNFTYDALNRPIIKLYRINGQPDPNTGDVEYLYDNASANGKGRPWIVYTWGANPFQTAVGGYDAVGRVTQLHRLFGNGQGGWHPSYDIGATYNLAGHLTSMTYPSGRTLNYGYDVAGRLTSFNGNLGDGTPRSYASGIEYSPFGGMSREQYGTQTPLYNKSFYNVRGQMFDKRLSSVNDTWDWNRGRLISYFSANHVWGGSGTDNNGKVRFQETWIPPPNATLDQAQYLIEDSYTYDALNRLTAVNESSLNIGGGGSWQGQFAQVYNYDRWGNRTVDQTNTWGAVPKPNFGVNTATNQLTAPGGYAMSYDAAGNLTNDTYTGQGARTYDAENHMKQAWGNNQWQTYVYDGEGARIKRVVNGTETWQVHGLGGELVAEYAPVATPSLPKKEYGYRNGALLITADAASGSGGSGPQPVTWTNAVGVAANSNNLTKTAAEGWGNAGAASTQTIASGDGYVELTASETNTYRMLGLSNGNTNENYVDIDFALYPAIGGTLYVYEGGVSRGTFGSYATGDTLRVAVEGGVVKYRKNGALLYTSTVSPTYPLLVDTSFYSNGGTVSNVMISTGSSGGGSTQNVSWTNTVGVSASGNNLTKTAAESWGNAGASSTQSIASGDGHVETTISETNKYRMIGLSNGDSHQNYYDIDFAFYPAIGGTLYIYEGGTSRGTFGTYATGDVLRVAVEGGAVKYRKNGTLVYTSTVTPTYPLLVDTSLYSSGATLTNVVISSGGGSGGGSSATIRWVVTDRLGTPRMIFDQTGSYSSVSRHDYLPFGEELYAGVGGRTTGLGYTNLDSLRQRFTGYERDVESGLDYAQARYHASQQGRFTSVDPLGASAEILDPQTFNRYSYVLNDPVNLTDPDGLMAGADQGWSSVASGFWGSSAGFDRPRAGAEIIGHRLSLHDTGIKRRQIELRQQQGFTNTEGEDVIVIYTAAFMSRQEAIAYYESQFGGPVAEYRGRFVLGRALWARQWQNRIAGGIDAASPFGFLTRAIAEKTVGGPPADETSDEYAQGDTVVTVASVVVPGPGGKIKGLKLAFGHGARHLAGTGLSQRVVERAIRSQVRQLVRSSSGTGGFWGRVVVGGRTVEYRAHTLADGTINIGTYYVK